MEACNKTENARYISVNVRKSVTFFTSLESTCAWMLPWLQCTQNKTIPCARTEWAKDDTYRKTTVHMDFWYINYNIPSSYSFLLGICYLYDKIIHFIHQFYFIKQHFHSWYCWRKKLPFSYDWWMQGIKAPLLSF